MRAVEALAGARRAALVGSWALLALAPGAQAAAPDGASERSTPFGLVSIDKDHPIAIRSAELEAVSSGGARQLLFTGDVEVEQADLRMTAGSLEASYPEGENQPDRLVARGDVVLTQDKPGKPRVEARCDEATYDRPARRVWCTGDAQLRDGDNVVRGRRIEFDLDRETVKVTGGASVVFHPGKDDVSPPAAPAEASGS